jgi:hypothetical protein
VSESVNEYTNEDSMLLERCCDANWITHHWLNHISDYVLEKSRKISHLYTPSVTNKFRFRKLVNLYNTHSVHIYIYMIPLIFFKKNFDY